MLCKLWVRYAACDMQLAIRNLRYANAGHVLNRIRFNGAAFIAILLYQQIKIISTPNCEQFVNNSFSTGKKQLNGADRMNAQYV